MGSHRVADLSRVLQKKAESPGGSEQVAATPAARVLQRSGGNRAMGEAMAGQAPGGGPSGGLPEGLRVQMESTLGHDFSSVRVRSDGSAAAMGARAYARGTDLHFAPGEYDPTSETGRALIGHELVHVVQQARGRVRATTQAKGLAVNDDPSLEREADVLGAQAARGERVVAGAASSHATRSAVTQAKSLSSGVVQKYGGNTPPAGVTPTPITSIDDFIAIVERAEVAYSGDDWQMLATRIRKSYYDGGQWNEMIADRASVARLAPTGPLSAEDVAALTRRNAVIPVHGQNIDIGHVFTALDAQNFPRAAGMIGFMGIHGPSGASWAGDVGSALAQWGLETESDLTTEQGYYERFASEADMLGDIDGLAISELPPPPPLVDSLSGRLRAYYSSTHAGNRGVDRRFTLFCRAAGFAYSGTGSAVTLDTASVDTIRARVRAFADAWDLKLRREQRIVFNASYSDADLDWFVRHFVDWVQAGLAREATPAVRP